MMAGFPLEPVGVFWDIDSCSIPVNKSAWDLIACVRNFFVANHKNRCLSDFIISGDICRLRDDIPEDMHRTGLVKFYHVNGHSLNGVAEKLRENMRRFFLTYAPYPNTHLVLISGDVDFTSELRNFLARPGFRITLIHAANCSPQFIEGWNQLFCYTTLCADAKDKDMPYRLAYFNRRPRAQNLTNMPITQHHGQAFHVPLQHHGQPIPVPQQHQGPPILLTRQHQGQHYPVHRQHQSQPLPAPPQYQGQPLPVPPQHQGPPILLTRQHQGQPYPETRQHQSFSIAQPQQHQGQSIPVPLQHEEPQYQGNENEPPNKDETNEPPMNIQQQPAAPVTDNQAANKLIFAAPVTDNQAANKIILLVSGLSGKIDFKIVKQSLQREVDKVHGKVKYVKNGQAFITFKNKHNADEAVKLFHGKQIFGKPVSVSFTKGIPYMEDRGNEKSRSDSDSIDLVEAAGAASGLQKKKNKDAKTADNKALPGSKRNSISKPDDGESCNTQ